MNVRRRARGTAKALRLLTLLAFERLHTGAVYSPVGAEYWSNPYPMYRLLQRRDPFHRSLLMKAWVISRYEDVSVILEDGRFLVDKRKLRSFERARHPSTADGMPGEQDETAQTMLTLDPPDHTRLRALVNRAFSPRAVEALRPRIQTIVQQCLDAVAPAGEMDIVRDLAVSVPVTVMAEMLGLPLEDRERFKRWSDEMVHGIGYPGPDDLRRSAAASSDLTEYLEQVVEERSQNLGDDLISALLKAEEAGNRLGMEEVVATCRLLLNAGHAMSTNLIGNGLLALLRHPDQMDALRGDPSLIGSAVEELLRYDGPAQATLRFVLEDVQLKDQTIRAGEQVVLLLGAANRDPERFTEPDRLDITRSDNHHLSFGHGIHRCPGAPLARLEAQVVLAAVIERFPKLRLASERDNWDHHMLVRGLKELPVGFS